MSKQPSPYSDGPSEYEPTYDPLDLDAELQNVARAHAAQAKFCESEISSAARVERERGKNKRMRDMLDHASPAPRMLRIEDGDGYTLASNLTDKDTNPKDAIGSNKLPLSVVPSSLVIYACLGHLEGALKYGKFNWRIAGVRASIYLDALKRHIANYENGEDSDPLTGVPHLSNALACIGILLDSKVCGKLNDDRAPKAPIGDLIRSLEAEVVRLKTLFKDHHPHQYTIADTPKEPS